MKISKMHGTGNDFVLFPNLKEEPLDYPFLARTLCKPHFGIGADGIIVILPSKTADFKMRMFNPDGSEAEMCGNGIRCFARYVYDNKLTPKLKFRVETPAGVMEPELSLVNGSVESVRVNMGSPRYGDLSPKAGQPLKISATDFMAKLDTPEGTIEGATVSMGNPHFVIFDPKWKFERYGQSLSVHKTHPHQSNIEFIEVLAPDAIRVQVWERGAGPTLACGSGACASMAAARILKGLPAKVRVEMPGGPLLVEWDGEGPIYLTGPASTVFEGEVSAELLKRAAHKV